MLILLLEVTDAKAAKKFPVKDEREPVGRSRRLEQQSAAFRPEQLLRQPGGFEGACAIRVDPSFDDLAVLEGEDDDLFQVNR